MRHALILSLLLVSAVDAMAGKGKVVIVNADPAGIGFNDTTPVEPVGGNPGTTLGQQRLNVFQAAADQWSKLLDTEVDILVQASFSPIPGCTETSAVLGQAGPFRWERDFANAPKANTWYPIALASKLAGEDLGKGVPDIFAQFNADIDKPTCLGDSDWYYGFDGADGNDSDLYVVVLHEIAHGLGVSGAVRSPGFRSNRPAVFDTHTYDIQAGLRWDQMTEPQRRVSMTNTGNLVWDGPNTRAFVNRYLQPTTTLTVTEPSIIARNYDIGTAAFGPAANRAAMTGRIIRAVDAANAEGPTANDGCTAFTNADAIAGNIAMVDRGTCTFVVKARNAQAAGATGLVLVDNKRETCTPPPMGGDASDITIPVISIAANDGDALITQLTASATVSGMLRNDPTQLAGTSKEGYMRLYAPCTDDPGSSTHHWDVVSTPNLLMEPSVNSDLLHGVDLTLYQLLDIGWTQPARSGRPTGKRR
jgi:hypothetical protein